MKERLIMKVLQTDKETFKIFGNSLDIKDKLPTKIYDVNFRENLPYV